MVFARMAPSARRAYTQNDWKTYIIMAGKDSSSLKMSELCGFSK
jgi:hypothetical protein